MTVLKHAGNKSADDVIPTGRQACCRCRSDSA